MTFVLFAIVLVLDKSQVFVLTVDTCSISGVLKAKSKVSGMDRVLYSTI